MGVSDDESIFIVDIEDDLGIVQVLNAEIGKLEVKGLLPDRVVGLLSHLSNVCPTAVRRVYPRTSTSTKPSTADLFRSKKRSPAGRGSSSWA